ncbi:MAG: VCBS repeat-containing protein [Planctomycetota bacterium]
MRTPTLILAGLLLGTSCGSGILGVAFSSNRGDSNNPEARAPSVQVNPASMPYMRIQGGFEAEILIRNYRLAEDRDPTKFDQAERDEQAERQARLVNEPDLVWLHQAQDGPDDLRVLIDPEAYAAEVRTYFSGFGYEDWDGEAEAPQPVLVSFVEGEDTRLIVDIRPTPFLYAVRSRHQGQIIDLDLPLRVVVGNEVIGGASVPFRFYSPPVIGYAGEVPARVAVDGSSSVTIQVSELVDPDPTKLEAWILEREWAEPLLVEQNGKLVDNPAAFRWRRATTTPVGQMQQVGQKWSGTFQVRPSDTRFPGPAELAVQGVVTGGSLFQRIPVLYEPVLQTVGARPGQVTGGRSEDWFVLGQGLVPAMHDNGKVALDLAKVRLEVEKDGRKAVVPGERFASITNDTHIFFALPWSPDGLPGKASIRLVQDFEGLEVQKTLEDGVRYGIADPVLGPRMFVPAPTTVALAGGRFLSDNPDRPDLAALSAVGAALVGEVQLYRRYGLGLYRALGRSEKALGTSVQIFDPTSIALASGQSRDGIFVGGKLAAGGPKAGLMDPTDLPEAPFQLVEDASFGSADPVERLLGVDLNEDGRGDLVALQERPSLPGGRYGLQLWVSSTTGYAPSLPLTVPAGVAGAVALAHDLDDDDREDIVTVSAETAMVHLSYGTGNGNFDPLRSGSVSFLSTDFKLADVKDVLGVHVLQGAGSVADLCVVAEMTQGITLFPVAWDSTNSRYVTPASGQALTLSGTDTFVGSSSLDMDPAPGDEVLVLARSSQSIAGSLRAFGYARGKKPAFVESMRIAPNVLDRPLALQALRLGEELPGGAGGNGLLVLHQETLDGTSQLVGSILPRTPEGVGSARPELELDNEPGGLARGRFTAGSQVEGLLSLSTDKTNKPENQEVVLHEDRGFGLLARASTAPATDAIPSTLARVARGTQDDFAAWLTANGDLVVRSPAVGNPTTTLSLDPVIDTPTWGGLGPESRLMVGDGDLDGHEDLVLLLVPRQAVAKLRIVFLRRDPQATGFPFLLPTGNLRWYEADQRPAGAELGALLGPGSGMQMGLELGSFLFMLTLYRETGTAANPYYFDLVPDNLLSQVLPFKSSGYTVLFADLLAQPGVEYDDLVSLSDRVLSVSFHPKRKSPTGRTFSVDLSRTCPLTDDQVLGLAWTDMNGDGLEDIVVVGEVPYQSGTRPMVVLYRNLGGGSFDNAYVYPSFLHGGAAASFLTGDLDGNGMGDLQLGRRTLLSR